jgi:hypothetical protein
VNETCLAVRRAVEEDVAEPGSEVMAHLAECRSCAEHAGLVRVLSGLAPREADTAAARELLLKLPIAPWQLRRPATWAPLALGGIFSASGLLLLGGVPAGGTLAGVPASALSLLGSSVTDILTAARGSADAVQALLTAGGSAALVWLAMSALGGSFAVRALLRRSARGRA